MLSSLNVGLLFRPNLGFASLSDTLSPAIGRPTDGVPIGSKYYSWSKVVRFVFRKYYAILIYVLWVSRITSTTAALTTYY